MKTVMKLSMIFLSLSVINVFANDLKIESNPAQADIYVTDLQGQQKIKLGETPRVTPLRDIFELQIKQSAVILEIVKDGYKPYRLVLPDIGLDTDVILGVTLESEKILEKQRMTDELITDLFEVQRLVRAKQYPEAEKTLTELAAKFNGLSTIPEMQGMTQYIQGDFEDALDFFKKAFVINPKNKLAAKMIAYLEDAMGMSKAPSQTPSGSK